MEPPEKADNQYWASQAHFTAWEAAFLISGIEPFEEPFGLTSALPEAVKKVRQKLLREVPNLQDGSSIPAQGWSCRSERPISTSGKVFHRKALLHWAQNQQQDVPPFLLN